MALAEKEVEGREAASTKARQKLDMLDARRRRVRARLVRVRPGRRRVGAGRVGGDAADARFFENDAPHAMAHAAAPRRRRAFRDGAPSLGRSWS